MLIYPSSFLIVFPLEWLESVGSLIVFELDPKKPILYVLPIESIIGKLPVLPAGDTGTITFRLRKDFDSDRKGIVPVAQRLGQRYGVEAPRTAADVAIAPPCAGAKGAA